MTTLKLIVALLAGLTLTACDGGDNATHVFPGGKITTSASGNTAKVKYETAYGDVDIEHDGSTMTMKGDHGETRLETDHGLDALGVELPEGVGLKNPKRSVASIQTPAGDQVMATLVTTRSPREIVAFYDERYALSTKTVVNDAASIAAELDDGRHLAVRVGPPKDGRRDLVVMVTKPRR